MLYFAESTPHGGLFFRSDFRAVILGGRANVLEFWEWLFHAQIAVQRKIPFLFGFCRLVFDNFFQLLIISSLFYFLSMILFVDTPSRNGNVFLSKALSAFALFSGMLGNCLVAVVLK